MSKKVCPKCGSSNITYQREQVGDIGASSNKVVIETQKRSKGCLYWLIIGWWWEPIYWVCFGWLKWLFGGRKKSGVNLKASKTINRTIGICQDCGHTIKV